MSFRDIGGRKRALHKHPPSQPPPSPSAATSKSTRQKKAEHKRDEYGAIAGVPTSTRASSSSNSSSNNRVSSKLTITDVRRAKSRERAHSVTPSPPSTPTSFEDPRERHVRQRPNPRGNSSIDTNSTTTTSSSMQSGRTSEGRKTKFSALSEEVKQFQRVVRDFEALVVSDQNGMSPEDQWRTRILLRTADAADRDIGMRVRDHPISADPGVRASFAKLNRDYERVHDTYQKVLRRYQDKQRAEISLLTSSHQQQPPSNAALDGQQEDFYEKAVREREEALLKMNSSMHKVNEIYKDLAQVVASQQDQIDTVEDNARDARAHTECGADDLHKRRQQQPQQPPTSADALCGALDLDITDDGDDFMERSMSFHLDAPDDRLTESDLQWTTPFSTLGADIVDVVKTDLAGVGRTARQLATASFMCGSIRCMDHPSFECGHPRSMDVVMADS